MKPLRDDRAYRHQCLTSLLCNAVNSCSMSHNSQVSRFRTATGLIYIKTTRSIPKDMFI